VATLLIFPVQTEEEEKKQTTLGISVSEVVFFNCTALGCYIFVNREMVL
jgi:hypothetical protein